MNEERLCPLCCENKTRGMLCTKCCTSLPGGCYAVFGKEWTIRGVPASQARCPQEERARVEAESKETLYTIQFSSNEVHFPCRTCSRMLELKKPELGVTSNTFCPGCDRQYWCDWQAGVLHTGLDNHDELYSRMMDKLTGTIRLAAGVTDRLR